MWDKKNYIVELKQVSVYQQKKMILTAINLQIRPTEFVYLLGATGSGKSSFLKLLYGELPFLEGEARVFDFELKKVDEISLPVLRRKLGIVAQEYPLLEHRSIEDNLQLILNATDWTNAELCRQRIAEVLALVKMTDKRFARPSELTKAERQRAIIARALLNKPSLLIVDEPTAGLDEEAAEDILTFLYSFAQATATAVLFATNNPAIPSQFPGRVLRFVGGKVNTLQHLPPPA